MYGDTTTKKQLLEALVEGDKAEDLICFYTPKQYDADGHTVPDYSEDYKPQLIKCSFDELPEREYDGGYGSVRGDPCIAFSDRYVYTKIQYDGSEWFEPIPRHPEFVALPIPIPGGS